LPFFAKINGAKVGVACDHFFGYLQQTLEQKINWYFYRDAFCNDQ
jgi:hypothetical protein